MSNLADLEIALIEEDSTGVTDFFSEVDRRTAATAYRKAAADFGFKTVEIGGVVFAHMGETATIMGYSNVSGLVNLMGRYRIQTPKIGWFIHDVKTIRKAFGLKEKDSQATLLPWEGFLVAGMYGRNAAAEKVKAYLLRMEREARIALELSTKESVAAERTRVDRLDVVTKAVARLESVSDTTARNLIVTEIERVTGVALPEPKQGRLHLVPSAPADGKGE